MLISDISLAKLVLENVRSHGIIGLTTDGTIVAWAAGAEDITGHTPEQAIGQKFGLLFSDADRAAGVPEVEIQTALTEGRAEDSRWHSRRDGSLFWGNGVTVDLGDNGLLSKIFRDETPAKRAEEQRVLLLNELNHRVKNTLATVQSIAMQTARSHIDPATFAKGFQARLMALSHTHDLLTRSHWEGADLADILEHETAAHGANRVIQNGPALALEPAAALSIGMIFHELATNAAKYGALSVGDGRVFVDWSVGNQQDRRLHLTWREVAGPAVMEPERKGFGSRLIERNVRHDLAGEAKLSYATNGFQAEISIPLDRGRIA